MNPFEPLRLPEEKLCHLDDTTMHLMAWDTTPRDLREKEQKSLPGYCKTIPGLSVTVALEIMATDEYKATRDVMIREKGVHDYKTKVVIDALYAAASSGDVQAAKAYLLHTQGTPPKPAPEPVGAPSKAEEPTTPAELTDEELQRLASGT